MGIGQQSGNAKLRYHFFRIFGRDEPMSRSREPQSVSHIRDYASECDLLALDGLLGDLHRVVLDSEGSSLKAPHGEGVLRWISVIALTAGWAMSAMVSSGIYPDWGITALGLLLTGVIAITILALRSAMQTIREWRALEAETVGAVGRNMARWYETVCKVRKTYSYEQISFAKRYVSDVAAQARGRLSLFIGALEKVGIIPLLASTAVTLANFNKDGTIPLVWCTAAAVAGLFYCFAMRLVDIALMLERFALILEHAATNQR